jgi:DNA modification methylase
MEKRQFEALKKNITEFGFLVPIITNKDLVIADGEHRWKAAIDLGMQEIPVLRLDVSEIDRRILRQVMNKLRGEHEKTGDIAEFMRIYEAGEIEHLKDLLALDQKEMSKIMDSLKNPVEDEAPPVPETTDIKLGDVFTLGEHKLMCGDSTKEEDVSKLMDGKKADMVFTDPPYGIAYQSAWRSDKFDILTQDEVGLHPDKWLTPIEKFCNKDIYICFGWQTHHIALSAILKRKWKLKNIIIWNKNAKCLMGDTKNSYEYGYEIIYFIRQTKSPLWVDVKDRESDVWTITKDRPNTYEHPTQKPIAIPSRAIKNSSKDNDIVLDLFGGSGSTLIACEQLNRKCYMLEIDPLYVQVIINRWENFTKKKAVKL